MIMATANIKTAKTCQWCGRLQQAKNGRLAHHGYTKEYGYFNGTCRGARELPFEIDREVKAKLIVALETLRNDWIDIRNNIDSEKLGIRREVRKWSHLRYEPKEYVTITRENFNELMSDVTTRNNIFYAGEDSFDHIKEKTVKYEDRKIKGISEDIEYQKKLYNEWKPTYTFSAGEWIKI